MSQGSINVKFILISLLKVSVIIVIGFFLDYSVNVILAHLLIPANYGDFIVAMYWLIFLSKFVSFGGPIAINKFLMGYINKKNWSKVIGLLYFYLGSAVIISLSVAVLTISITIINHKIIKDIEPNHYHLIILALFLLPLLSCIDILVAVFQSHKQFLWAKLPQDVINPFLFLILIAVFYYLNKDFNSWHAVGLMAVVYSLIILILVYILKKSLKIKLIHIKNIKVRPKEWLKISLPIMLVSSISVLFMSQIDLTMLEVMGKDENSVGYYAAGLKTAGIIILLTTTTSTVFTPIISQAIDKSKKHLKHIYRVQFYFSIVVCIIIIFVLFIFGCNFLTLFGNSYITAYSTMLILSIGYGAILISNGAYIILQYSNSAKFLLFSNLFGVTFNLILNWFLIPIYDIEGAAIATACSMSSIATLHIFHIWQKHKIT